MQKLKFIAIVALGLSTFSHAYATTLSYDHEYEDVSGQHTDEFSIAHKFGFGLKASATVEFEPHEKSNGDAGDIFNDDRWSETKVGLGYPLQINSTWALIPGISLARKHDEYKYKPYLKAKVSLSKDWELSTRYRYEITHYTTDKKTKKNNRFDIGTSYKINALTLGYTFTYYHANKDLFDNKKTDYENEVTAEYKLTKKWSPYIELKNEAVSSKTDQRQTEYKIGFKYKL
ncbi:oligogalacturonate-specific porin KdgM family protein [Celerinatantimonas diazotrophica]|uniref:Oligogalacturonate-specific porin n=1 Tax=Celerinatantimonas diazotrophica TaxID=412034 RepID=A0A4R1J934_9GAMM|nr:oligogalacturonate-specific porin KdgM family protein [Celerinatantimonas diazotrophica]TCK47102.1 oligogalacturonate-specific porin [Celerinatantimonas diazotrophica]CAG9295871.1 Oligogalacturonate-specific porin KdgM [Celerinatantimonas diazotrophica]